MPAPRRARRRTRQVATNRGPPAAAPPAEAYRQGDLFSAYELVGRAVAALDVDATTPLAALELLARWQRDLRPSEP